MSEPGVRAPGADACCARNGARRGARRLILAPLAAPAFLALLGLLLQAQGCGTTPPAPTRYDFYLPGHGDASAALPPGTQIDVVAPAWLDTTAVLYRLNYADGSQVHAYTQSQWVAPPARLLEQTMRQGHVPVACAPVRAGDATVPPVKVRVELEEFSQMFSAPEASEAVLRARVVVLAAHSHDVLEERDFDLRGAASPADAVGAVHGLRDLAHALADSVLAYAAPRICAASPQGPASP